MTERNPASSAAFPLRTALRDGTPVVVRPVRPDDKHLLEVGMEHLSTQDRYFRFFRPIGKLSDTLLDRFTEIDHFDHEAIGAMDAGKAPSRPAGVARYIRIPSETTAAEVAVTVVPSHQGKGLGSLLLGVLARRAVENGVREFSAIVLEDNYRMLDVFGELGFVREQIADGEIELRIPLFDDAALYPQTPVGDVFRQASALLNASG
ncbi:MAG: GNAT family N-acetyltransferase [Aestuariivirgaceae bacterium]